MNKKVENKFSGYKLLLDLCESNVVILMILTGLNDIYSIFKAHVSDLEILIQRELFINTGYGIEKQEQKKLLIESCLVIEGGIYAWAAKNNNHVMMEQVKYSKSSLEWERDTETLEICRNVLQAGLDNLGDLGDFGVDAVLLQGFKDCIDLYELKIPKPKAYIKSHAEIVKLIDAKVRTIDGLLKNQFDKAILGLMKSNGEFVATYFSSRKLMKDGLRHPKKAEQKGVGILCGNVTDAFDGLALEDVEIGILELNLNDVTNDEGDYCFEEVPTGEYTIVFRYDTYKDVIKNRVKIEADSETCVDVVLEADPGL